MTHPFELMIKNPLQDFTEKLLVAAILRLSVSPLHSGNTFSEIYDALREDVKQNEAQKLTGPQGHALADLDLGNSAKATETSS